MGGFNPGRNAVALARWERAYFIAARSLVFSPGKRLAGEIDRELLVHTPLSEQQGESRPGIPRLQAG